MIKLLNLEKSYENHDGRVCALKGINLEIARGEIFGIIGLSGAGKSTLVRCINMLERPTSGKIIVDGKDMTKLSNQELRVARKKIGMIFQHFNLLNNSTVYDNVAFPLTLNHVNSKEIAKKVEKLLEFVDLKDKAEQYPSQLSGGQKQRVGIARALANDPKILLCDEATSALDPQTTKAILKLIKNINKELSLTLVMITHEMQVIKEICDKVAVIYDGVIAEQGTVIEVFTNPQHDITKEFISAIWSNKLPPFFNGNKISRFKIPGSIFLIRMIYLGAVTYNSIVERMVRTCHNVKCNLFLGNLDEIQGTPFGRLIVGLEGSENAVQEALNFLRNENVRVEVIGYVNRNNSTVS